MLETKTYNYFPMIVGGTKYLLLICGGKDISDRYEVFGKNDLNIVGRIRKNRSFKLLPEEIDAAIVYVSGMRILLRTVLSEQGSSLDNMTLEAKMSYPQRLKSWISSFF